MNVLYFRSYFLWMIIRFREVLDEKLENMFMCVFLFNSEVIDFLYVLLFVLRNGRRRVLEGFLS